MNSRDIEELLKKRSSDPCFFVDFYNLERGIVGDCASDKKPYIKQTKSINYWLIVDDKLQKVDDKIDFLFDAETYIIQWMFELVVDGSVKEELLFYYWKGNNAFKGFSPLPIEIENQDTIVERIRQWSEPAIFFHMFFKPLVVFSGKSEEYSPNIKRLFIVRGELESEIHLFEVPCLKESLRSRAVFLLIEPSRNIIFYWWGTSVTKEYRKLVIEKLNQIKFDNMCHFKKVMVREGQDDFFFEALGSKEGNYVKVKNNTDFTPKLFYLNSITGNFLATEVIYPLRSNKHVAPFPFLQSHLYTAIQPAFFLLDNNSEIWLWEGWLTPESNLELYNVELKLAKETAVEYSKEKEKINGLTIPVKHVIAGLEPIEFINIFPYWNKRDDVVTIQLKGGRSADVRIINQ